MNSRFRQGAMVGSGPAAQVESGQEVRGVVDVDGSLGQCGIDQSECSGDIGRSM